MASHAAIRALSTFAAWFARNVSVLCSTGIIFFSQLYNVWLDLIPISLIIPFLVRGCLVLGSSASHTRYLSRLTRVISGLGRPIPFILTFKTFFSFNRFWGVKMVPYSPFRPLPSLRNWTRSALHSSDLTFKCGSHYISYGKLTFKL